MVSFTDRIIHAWNAFTGQSTSERMMGFGDYGPSYGSRPDRARYGNGNERSIVSSVYTRLSIDVSEAAIKHVRLDDNDRFTEEIRSNLNECLTVEANLDQAARMFRQDIALSLFENGVAAIVPVDTTLNPKTGSFDIKSMRIGTVTDWMPEHVKVSVYNEKTGRKEVLLLEKKFVAIIENPLYSVMNEPNSTLQRLIRKLAILDAVDEQSGSGKLDLIIQLPYTIKSEARRQQAEQRRKDIELQLKGSRYGIAYTDGTEKITQLNRAAENNLWKQITDLTDMLYGQLGITPEIMNGTADEKAMLNYHNRTVQPILDAIVEEMRRKFLTKTARTQKQSIVYFRDPFKLVPIEQIAEIGDKFTRNEILSANELRQIVGMKPSKDPKADELRNSNMPEPTPSESEDTTTNEEGDSQNGRQERG